MSWYDNDTLLEEAVELADTLGGPWPERVAELINHSDLEELDSVVKSMRLNQYTWVDATTSDGSKIKLARPVHCTFPACTNFGYPYCPQHDAP